MCLPSNEPEVQFKHKIDTKNNDGKVPNQGSFALHNPTEHRRFIASLLLKEWTNKKPSTTGLNNIPLKK